MSILSPPAARPASTHGTAAAARPRWSFGQWFSRAIVILVGVAVGCLIGVLIGVLAGWIEIQIIC